MTRKTNTMFIALLGTILMGLSTWVLISIIELGTIVSMMFNGTQGYKIQKGINKDKVIKHE